MSAEPHAIRVTIGTVQSAAGHLSTAPDQDPDQPEPRTPPIDIHEGAEGLVLEADLPGVTDRTITVELQDNVLTLQATVDVTLPEGARPLYLEFLPTPFARSFILSDDVDRSRIDAEVRQGVLHLNLPRAERATTRRIEVKGS